MSLYIDYEEILLPPSETEINIESLNNTHSPIKQNSENPTNQNLGTVEKMVTITGVMLNKNTKDVEEQINSLKDKVTEKVYLKLDNGIYDIEDDMYLVDVSTDRERGNLYWSYNLELVKR